MPRFNGSRLLYGLTGSGGDILPVKIDPDNGVGALAINVQDQHSPPFNARLYAILATTALSVDAAPGDWSITLTPGHGFVAAGEQVLIRQGDQYQYAEVVAVAVNVISLDTQVDYVYTTGAATVYRVSYELKVDGSIARQVFATFPPPGLEYDVYGVRANIVSSGSPDDVLFGDIARLLRGVNVHILLAEGLPFSLGTFHTNGEFFLGAGTLDYTTKGGGGNFTTRIDAKIREDWGIAIRLRGTVAGALYTRDEMRVVVQDNLTGLVSFRMEFYGHVVQ